MFLPDANGGSWNSISIRCALHHRRCVMKNRLRRREMRIPRRRDMRSRRCAILNAILKMTHAARCAALADCIGVHFVESAVCYVADCLAVL
jgi:hypothetical protein